MILVDTSIWIDHFRKNEPRLEQLLLDGDVVTHPLIVLELALGSTANRNEVISNLKQLPRVKIADQEELFQLVEARSLYRRGIGVTDLHLLASALFEKSVLIWTRDRRLGEIATALGLRSDQG